MKKGIARMFFVLTVVALVACAEEDDRQSAAADTNQIQYAQTAVDDLGAVRNVSVDATSAGSAQGTLANLYGSYNSMASYSATPDGASAYGVVAYADPVACAMTGTYTWDTTSVTYDNCDGLSGTISWSGDTYTFDNVVYDFGTTSQGMYTGNMSYDGSITITDTSIEGSLSLSYDYSTSSAGYDLTYASDMAIAYNAIGLDADGCPSSGSLDLAGDYHYDYAGQTYDSSFDITYEFNACGDVTVRY